ncbi:MAG: helix-turn-helix domain-containing protein [Bacteroidetes bacterium]|jgi:transcriptional regulator with XRE-family HTH domain|nr:helix-turn-helix domain-containing protein [Bacteroidota bacterium]
MHFLGSNIRWLRKNKKLTQEELANKIGVKRTLVGAYEEGRVEPKLRTLLAIGHYFSISVDDLIRTDLQQHPQQTRPPDIKGRQLRILPVVTDRTTEEELSTLVPVKASAGYTKGYGDVDFIESLPKFNLPYPELAHNRTYRLFQIAGESMLPVPPRAYIICEYEQDWHNIKNEMCYVLVTKDEGIVYKRLINNLQDGELVLKSDNPEYKPCTIQADQVIEVWKARGYTCFDLHDDIPKTFDVSTLIETIAELKNDVKQLKKKMMEK